MDLRNLSVPEHLHYFWNYKIIHVHNTILGKQKSIKEKQSYSNLLRTTTMKSFMYFLFIYIASSLNVVVIIL